jgi:hypothetical protein
MSKDVRYDVNFGHGDFVRGLTQTQFERLDLTKFYSVTVRETLTREEILKRWPQAKLPPTATAKGE